MQYAGQCHCGAIRIVLSTHRPPGEQVLGACQCSFCRKHNARTFSDPKAHVTLRAVEPEHLQRYLFGLRTSEQILCRRCGVYVAMTLRDGPDVWSVVNIDTLDDRALFTRTPQPRDYSAEDRAARIARRKARWIPTMLIDWPASQPG
jgi:hypothetical protein